VAPGVKDEAAFFSSSALAQTTREIKEIQQRFKRWLVIETFPDVPAERAERLKAIDLKDTKAVGNFFAGWAEDRWRTADSNNIYIILCKNPQYIQLKVSPDTAQRVLTAPDRRRLVGILVQGLREAGKAREGTEKQRILDKALLDAVALVAERLEIHLNPPRFVQNGEGHSAYSGAQLFTQDDRELITVGFDNTIRVWDARTLRQVEVVRPPRHGGLYRVALSPDGRHLAVASGDLIYLIARQGWKIEHVLTGHKGNIRSLAFSADGARLASVAQEKTVRVWSRQDGSCERTLEGHTDLVRDVAFAPDGGRLLTNSKDGTARIWSLKTGEAEAVLPGHPKGAHKVAWSPDGKTLVTGGMGELRFWNANGSLRTTLGGFGNNVHDLQFTPDSRRLLCTQNDDTATERDLCAVIDVASGKTVARLAVKSRSAEPHTALTHDGKLAMTTGAADLGWIIWTVADGRIVRNRTYGTLSPGTAHPGQAPSGKGAIQGVGWSPEENRVIAFGQSERFLGNNDLGPLERSFDLANLEWGPKPTSDFRRAREVRGTQSLVWKDPKTVVVKHGDKPDVELSFESENQTVFCYTLLPENRAAIGTRRYAVYIMDTLTGKKISSHFGHDATVTSVAPSPDDQYLLTCDEGTIRVWLQNPTRLLLLFGVDGDDWIAWTPEGYFAASPGGERLMGWEVSNGPDQVASFHTAARFRKSFYRPDVIKLVLEERSVEKALARADKERGMGTALVNVSQVLPPRVAITSPTASGVRINDKTLEVKAVARSVGTNPVTELRLLLDGRPVPGAVKSFPSPTLGEAHATWTIEVLPGSQRLTVQANSTGSRGVSEPLEIVGAGAAGKASGKLYLLVVGINDYLYLGNRLKLDSAAPDARSIHQAFQDLSRPLFRSIESRLLLDRQATRANILNALQWLKQSARPGDKAVVFYAGHGDSQIIGQYYLVPVDARLNDLRSTGVSDEEITRAIGELPCTTVLMLDACDSGGFGVNKKRKTRSLAKPSDALAGSLVNDYGVATLCAARDNQEAIEEGGHGFFTQALTQGLSGEADVDRDGVVELYELLPFVHSRVRKLSAGDQVPTFGLPQSIESFPMTRPRGAGR
jgi:WD40 repeat protein